jgi:hypothetical protein
VAGLAILFFCGYLYVSSGTKEIVNTARNGAGEMNQGGWEFFSATERERQQRLSRRHESGIAGLASFDFSRV